MDVNGSEHLNYRHISSFYVALIHLRFWVVEASTYKMMFVRPSENELWLNFQ